MRRSLHPVRMAKCHPARRHKALDLCNPCYRRQRQAKRRAEGDLAHHRWRLKRYNLTVEEYAAKLKEQDGRCAICNRKFNRRLCVDHSHVTKQNRGLLCTACNLGIAKFEENIEFLQNAIRYLIDWND